MIPEILAATALLTLGYLLGRVRPIRAVDERARWAVVTGHISILHVLTLLTLHPWGMWKAWQRSNEPPAPRSPAPKIRGLDEESDPLK